MGMCLGVWDGYVFRGLGWVCVWGSGMGMCLGVWDGYVFWGLRWVCVWGSGMCLCWGSGMGMCLGVWDGYMFGGLGWVCVFFVCVFLGGDVGRIFDIYTSQQVVIGATAE